MKWLFNSSCTQSIGTAKASGTCSVTMPATAGTYEFRLFGNNLFTLLATSNTVTVGGGGAAGTPNAATLTVSPTSVKKGKTITVSWSGVQSPTSTDWISVYYPGAPNSQTLYWVYTSSCSQKAGSAKASGSCTIPMKREGTFEVRLFANNS